MGRRLNSRNDPSTEIALSMKYRTCCYLSQVTVNFVCSSHYKECSRNSKVKVNVAHIVNNEVFSLTY